MHCPTALILWVKVAKTNLKSHFKVGLFIMLGIQNVEDGGVECVMWCIKNLYFLPNWFRAMNKIYIYMHLKYIDF